MKTLILLPSNRIGGAENVCFNVAKNLDYKNLEIFFLSTKDKTNKFNDLNCTLIFSNNYSEFVGAFKFVFYLIKSRKNYEFSFSSHIHCNFFISILSFLGILRIRKTIFRESTNFYSRFRGHKLLMAKIMHSLYRIENSLIVFQTSKMEKEIVMNSKNIANSNYVTLSNPIDFENINNLSTAYRTNFLDNVCNIVCVARLESVKRHDDLVKSLKLIRHNVHMHFVGDGTQMDALKELSNKLGVLNKITFHGNKNNPYPFMREANINILVSETEGFPNVINEYLVFKKPVIVSKCTEGLKNVPDINLVEIKSPLSIAKEIECLIDSGRKIDYESRYSYLLERTSKNYVNNIVNLFEQK